MSVISIQSTHRSSLSTKSLRDLVKRSIDNAAAVKIEVRSGDVREVVFTEFLVEDRNVIGTTDNGVTTVVVLFPKKVYEERIVPIVILGR